MRSVWLLAFAGALVSWLGDVVGVLAARSGAGAGVVQSAVLFGAAAPFWYLASRKTGGQFATPAVIWNTSAAVLSLVAALVLDGKPTPRQWCSLLLFAAAVVVRG